MHDALAAYATRAGRPRQAGAGSEVLDTPERDKGDLLADGAVEQEDWRMLERSSGCAAIAGCARKLDKGLAAAGCFGADCARCPPAARVPSPILFRSRLADDDAGNPRAH